jgi:hypothetical protein
VITTRIRLLTANFRLEPVPSDIAAGRGWPDRRPAALALLKTVKPSVICGQECSTNIRNDIAAALGPNWHHYRNGNAIIFYDSNQHTMLATKTTFLPTPPLPDGSPGDLRRLVLVHLRMKATGDDWWAASTHFSAGVEDGPWKIKQMQAVVAYIKANGDPVNTILGGDINSSLVDDPGPRTVARAAGLYPLRDKLAAPRITNVTATTYGGWTEPSPHNNVWIDDIFCGSNFQPYWAKVLETDGASDHNFLVASSIKLT